MVQAKSVKALDAQTLALKGQQLYEEKLCSELEAQHLGEFVAIEAESGEYFVGQTLDETLRRAEQSYPDKLFHVVRIGRRGVHAVRSFTT